MSLGETDWLAKQPKKFVAVKAILKSERNNILLVKPTYKNFWQFPGGGVEKNEEPRLALIREIREEVGLDIEINNLILTDTVFEKKDDVLTLVYEYQSKISEDATIILPEDELEEFKFVTANEAINLLAPRYEDLCRQHLS